MAPCSNYDFWRHIYTIGLKGSSLCNSSRCPGMSLSWSSWLGLPLRSITPGENQLAGQISWPLLILQERIRTGGWSKSACNSFTPSLWKHLLGIFRAKVWRNFKWQLSGGSGKTRPLVGHGGRWVTIHTCDFLLLSVLGNSCCVVGCHSKVGKKLGLRFFRFPLAVYTRALYEVAEMCPY